MAAILRNIYYNAAGGFSGIQALKRAVSNAGHKNISVGEIREWLATQDTYTLHKPPKRTFKCSRVVVGGLDQQWQADLVDVRRHAKDNKGVKFLLCVIDILSKYAWVVPVKSTQGSAITQAFEHVLKTSRRKPLALQTDKGGEFLNQTFQTFLKRHNIHFFTSHNVETKASVVERFNRTLKTKLWRYMEYKNSDHFVHVLPTFVASYNSSYHRSIKMAPKQVNAKNMDKVWYHLYGKDQLTPHLKEGKASHFKLGDTVRITIYQRNFRRGFRPKWTDEVFTIAKIYKNASPQCYGVKDAQGDLLEGTFYAEELQKVTPEKQLWVIEKIVQRKGKHILVKWKGLPASENSWISPAQLDKYWGRRE